MARKRGRVEQPESTNERRKRGTRIKKGLTDLGELDAAPPPPPPPQSSARIEVQPGAVDSGFPAERTTTSSSLPFSLSSSSFSAPSVFGRGWDEWKLVKQLLFNTSNETGATEARRREALNRIQLVWKARERKNRPLPAYAETTALLVEAVLLDEGGRLSSSGAVTFYGAAISRAVHLMTGTFSRGAADTYRKRARMIGFPEEAVEVRQRMAHGAPPLLSELRWVCGLVLQFLFQHYWVEQERHLHLMEEEKDSDGLSATEAKLKGPSTTVEEMRQLLEELSDITEDAADDLNDHTEVVLDGWYIC